MAKNAHLVCERATECSPSVGLITFAEGNATLQCTGALISEDIVLTNAHCLPKELQHAGANCFGRVFMTFAKYMSTNRDARLDCLSILEAENGSDLLAKAPDYAFLRMKQRTSRPFLALSRNGLKNNEIYDLIKIDPTSDPHSVGGIQKLVKCRTDMNTFFNRRYVSDKSQVAGIGDCNVIHGNSGSPLLANDGTVRGVVFAVTEMQLEFFKRKGIVFPLGIKAPAYVSNLSCLRFPGYESNPGAIPLSCDAPEPNNAIPEQIKLEVEKQKLEIIEQHIHDYNAFSWFKWKVDRQDLKFRLSPVCFFGHIAALGHTANIGPLLYERHIELDDRLHLKKVKLMAAKTKSSNLIELKYIDEDTYNVTGDLKETLSVCPKGLAIYEHDPAMTSSEVLEGAVSTKTNTAGPLMDRASSLGLPDSEVERAAKSIGSVLCNGKPVSSAALVGQAKTALAASVPLASQTCIFQNAANPPDKIEIISDSPTGAATDSIRQLRLKANVAGAIPYQVADHIPASSPKYVLFDAFFSSVVNPLQEPMIAPCAANGGKAGDNGCGDVPGALQVAYVDGRFVVLGMSDGKMVQSINSAKMETKR